nr:MAG TPA: hypothetical protein [Caudoviricetes sp.]
MAPFSYLMLEREKERMRVAYLGDLQWMLLVKTIGVKPEDVLSYTQYSALLDGKPQPLAPKRDVKQEVADELNAMLMKYLPKKSQEGGMND